MKFIYVFSVNEKEKLQKAGFTLLKEDSNGSVYIFGKNDSLTFALNDISYVESNTLTF